MSTVGDLYIEQGDKLRAEQAAHALTRSDVAYYLGACRQILADGSRSADEQVAELAEQIDKIRHVIGLD